MRLSKQVLSVQNFMKNYCLQRELSQAIKILTLEKQFLCLKLWRKTWSWRNKEFDCLTHNWQAEASLILFKVTVFHMTLPAQRAALMMQPRSFWAAQVMKLRDTLTQTLRNISHIHSFINDVSLTKRLAFSFCLCLNSYQCQRGDEVHWCPDQRRNGLRQLLNFRVERSKGEKLPYGSSFTLTISLKSKGLT